MDQDEQMRMALEAVRRRFVGVLRQRMDQLARACEMLKEQHCRSEALTQIAFESHRIAGTAATLGFAGFGARASEIEHAVGQRAADSVQAIPTDIVAMVVELIREGEEILGQPLDPAKPAPGRFGT